MGAALAVLLASAALAQQPAATGQDARAAISAEGKAAMERLRAAAKPAQDQLTGPTLPKRTDDPAARRAFEGLRKRAAAPALEARVRGALDAGEARMAAEREAMASRLRQALGLAAPEMAAIAKATPAPGPKTWVPLLLVSSSMPLAELRTYAQQLERVRGVLAFRGMPGGLAKVGPMAKLSADILRIDPGCSGPACAMRGVQLIVDPIVFRQHSVTRVPALAMIPGDPTQAYCEREAESPRASHVVYGDSALAGLLEEYARLGGKEEVRDAQSLAAR
ncbi:type-F conjugative transfer system pilin assembly protein TrbC [Sphingomonas sp. CA1-15]|uniref:Type-F conjugative transfer system pilin assembly protein TrbC n=1 Tax=Sphingomonas immobilis TaxID=3063997 RepID=A0ABT8ZVZ3_9SPHN|nr:type-F conjugative transfer system pilin assembly protein TrbC [Sphingomonas sp. CA1-15]